MESKSMSISTLLLMAGLHFTAMYFLMFAMVNSFESVYLNLNNFYMAAIMTAPMLVIEGILMKSMYENKQLLRSIVIASVILFSVFFMFIRQQIGIGDKEFLRSMIPHHSGAILMCRDASLEDPEIRELCSSIIEAQQVEIDQMRQILERLE